MSDNYSVAVNLTQPSMLPIPVSSLQILNLNTTPVTLIPAPGVGKSIVVNQCLFRFTAGGSAYLLGGTLTIGYSGGVAALTTLPNTTLQGASSDSLITPPNTSVIAPQNTSITLSTPSAFTTGNGTVSIFIWYSIQ